MAKVIIGVDPHKALGHHRVDKQSREGCSARPVRHRPGRLPRCGPTRRPGRADLSDRGSNGAGRPWPSVCSGFNLGEHVVDVPAKARRSGPALRHRPCNRRKTELLRSTPHSIAASSRSHKTARPARRPGEQSAADAVCATAARTTRLGVRPSRLHRLSTAELVPGKAKKDLALQARQPPRHRAPLRHRRQDPAQDRCRGLADLLTVEAKMKKATAGTRLVKTRGSRLMDLHGVGPVVAARTLADVGDIARFADRNRFLLDPAPHPSMPHRAERTPPPSPGRNPQKEPHDPHRHQSAKSPSAPGPGPTSGSKQPGRPRPKP